MEKGEGFYSQSFLGQKKEEGKLKKFDKEKSIPITWFVLTIILVVVLSFLISAFVLNMYASANNYSSDSGKIIVQVQPTIDTSSGKIVVEVKDEKEVKNGSS